MDETLILWIVVNACAIGGLLVFIPMAVCETFSLIKWIKGIFWKGEPR